MRVPRIGDAAPEFCLPGTGGKTYCLKEFRDQVVVLAFYPGDDTAVCTLQLSSYSRDIAEFNELNAVVFGISPQGIDSHESFKSKRDLKMELLADTEKEVGALYGILGPLGFYRRSVFVIDKSGIIRYIHRAMTGAGYRPSKELLAAVQDAS